MSLAPIKIESAELRLVRMPLLHPFTIATGTMYDKIFPLLILRSSGHEGYAESVVDPVPDYLDETIPASMALLKELFLPQIVGKPFENARDLSPILDPWRGHYMTKAVVEMAFWDLWAKSLALPLQTVLGGEGDAIDVGVSLGIYGCGLDGPDSSEARVEMTPTGFTVPVRDIRAYTGAGWLVALCGDMQTMPGLGKHPAAFDIDLGPDGRTVGLF